MVSCKKFKTYCNAFIFVSNSMYRETLVCISTVSPRFFLFLLLFLQSFNQGRGRKDKKKNQRCAEESSEAATTISIFTAGSYSCFVVMFV